MKFSKLLALGLVLFGLALPNARADLVAGRDYGVIDPPQPTQSGNKIEVIEFFWYGCPHCYDFQPTLKKWLRQAPKDVEFRYVPGIFRDNWVPAAKIYYTLEALGDIPKLHEAVYDAIHLDNLDLNNEQVLLNWVAKQGVDRKKFADIYNSFAVQSKVKRAWQMTKDYHIQGVPSLVVDGRYVTSGAYAGSNVIKVLDELIEKARKERASRR